MAANAKINAMKFSEWDFANIWAEMKMPAFGVEALIATHQKNYDAMNLANKAAVNGWQALAKKQAELLQVAFEGTGALAQDVATAEGPADKLAKQAKFAKSYIEAGISNAREAQEVAFKAANETVEIVSKRFSESVDEAVALVGKGVSAATTSAK